MRRFWIGAFLCGFYVVLAVLHGLLPPPARVDLGRWRVVVLQSDDWGFEGWFPDLEAARDLVELTRGLEGGLKTYARSSLETAAEVESLTAVLRRHRDADGLPAVLQANAIVAAVATQPAGFEERFRLDGSAIDLRVPGCCGPYARPGLPAAVDRARAAGVWRAELHGLTHFDLDALEHARESRDPLEARARRYGVVAFPGWRSRAELGSGDPARARSLARLAVERFRLRYGRDPVSVIAPDYVWGPEDEAAWHELGLQVVQAKREQIDPARPPVGWWGRMRKVLGRLADRRRDALVYLERHARLEPYGSLDPRHPQGVDAAEAAVRAAWARGEAAVVEVHRVQFAGLDASVGRAGRAQLDELLQRLESSGPVRYCVDAEVAQLRRRGWSVLDRGPWTIVRNYGDGAFPPPALPRAPGTHRLPRVTHEDLSRRNY
jgi:hypothetical protein